MYGKCFWCGKERQLETHHIFWNWGGALRRKADRLGLTVDLCHDCHQAAPYAAHRCGETNRALRKFGQRKAMLENNWTKEDFIHEFGRNFLDDEELAEIEDIIWIKGEPAQPRTEGTVPQSPGGDSSNRPPVPGSERIDPFGAALVALAAAAPKGFQVKMEVMPF